MNDLAKEAEEALGFADGPMSEKLRRAGMLALANDYLTTALAAARVAIDLTVNGHAALTAGIPLEEAENRRAAINQLLQDTFNTVEHRGRQMNEAINGLCSLILTRADFFPVDTDQTS